jgi:hypothetical protein
MRPMSAGAEPGRHIEILFTDEDRTLELDTGDGDADRIADGLVEAINTDDAREAELSLRIALDPDGSVDRIR